MTAEPDDLTTLLRSFTPANPQWRQSEAEARVSLDALPTAALPGLDHDVRWSTSWSTTAWDDVTVDEAGRLLAEAGDPLTVAAAFSMHSDGHVRQLAVAALDRAATPRAIRWLLLRCGDWVPQVRDAARAGLEPWLTPRHADELVDSLPLVEGGRFDPRRPAADLRQRIHSVVSDPASRPAVERGSRSTNRQVRRTCTRLLIEADADVALLQQVIATDDVVAVALVTAALPTQGPTNRTAGEILHRSPIARFRYEGLWRLTKDDEPGSEALARRALADPAASVRAVAQRWLSAHGGDTADAYRAMLATDPLAALRGLGDRPRPGDAAVARDFVDHDRATVRAAALRLLASAADQTDGPLFARRFMAGTGSERRPALAGLHAVGAGPFLEELWTSARATGDVRAVERVLFQVLPRAGRWKRIELGLDALAADEPVVRRMGFEVLARIAEGWNRGYIGPPADLEGMRRQLDLVRPGFSRPDQHPGQNRVRDFLEQVLQYPPPPPT